MGGWVDGWMGEWVDGWMGSEFQSKIQNPKSKIQNPLLARLCMKSQGCCAR
jgi:hypothetical protein